MTAGGEAPYTLRELQQMLGLSRGVIGRLIDAQVVNPTRGPRNEYRFRFQDVVLLRTAHELHRAQVPRRRLLNALRQLRRSLPASLPLSGLRIKAMGDRVAVLSGDAAWDPQSGQLLLDLEVTGRPTEPAPVLVFRAHPAPGDARSWHARGQALEPQDPAAAEAAYRMALALDPSATAVYVDLGALLCNARRCADALTLFAHALRLAPADPRIHFNAAIALDDQGRPAEALDHYEQCLRLDPTLADAHFNAAQLCEQLGDARGALRHFSAYRRLARALPQPEES